MISEYNYKNKIHIEKLEEMYKILVNNMFIIYPDKIKLEIDNEENHNKWINSINSSKDYQIITYSIDNNLIAFLSYNIIDNNLWISEVQVKDNYKNKEILKKLLKQFLCNKITKRYKEIYIHINSKNIISQQVFKHIGFKLKENTIYTIKIEELIKYIYK